MEIIAQSRYVIAHCFETNSLSIDLNYLLDFFFILFYFMLFYHVLFYV